MVPATEYMVRNSYLTFPFSLCLAKDRQKLIVSVYQKKDKFLVQHWKLWEDNKKNIFPPCEEFLIGDFLEKSVLSDFSMMHFIEQPFISSERQIPNSKRQEKDYQSCLDNFYYPKILKDKKIDWLWRHFHLVHHSNKYHSFYAPKNQMGNTKHYDNGIWKKWLLFKRILEIKGNIAPELYFDKLYPAKSIPIKMPTWILGSSF